MKMASTQVSFAVILLLVGWLSLLSACGGEATETPGPSPCVTQEPASWSMDAEAALPEYRVFEPPFETVCSGSLVSELDLRGRELSELWYFRLWIDNSILDQPTCEGTSFEVSVYRQIETSAGEFSWETDPFDEYLVRGVWDAENSVCLSGNSGGLTQGGETNLSLGSPSGWVNLRDKSVSKVRVAVTTDHLASPIVIQLNSVP